MKKYCLILAALFCFGNSFAFERLNFNTSKPLCVLTFLQAASGTGSVSPALSEFIRKNLHGSDSVAFYQLAGEFSAINLRYSYAFPGYPERRQVPKTVLDMITKAAVQSGSTDEFFTRIAGILPNEQWVVLKNLFTAAEPFYDRMITEPYKKDIANQLAELQKYNSRADDIFTRLKRFYGSIWADDLPFTISVYPVPGRSGTTTATPHSNSLVLAVLTGHKDYANHTSVAIHEICHVLYQEQPLSFQLAIDSFFTTSTSPYRLYAYNYIDEALATASGNGWAYKQLSGHMDTADWYNDKYINGFAHAIYPMVAAYVEKGRAIDKEFTDKAILLFAQTFPEAMYDYDIMLSRMSLYTDADNDAQYQQVTSVLYKYFNISGCAGAYPIADPQVPDLINHATNTQLFLVYTNHRKNYELLQQRFPRLAALKPEQEGIIHFLDDNKRPVIVVNAKNQDRLETGIRKLASTHKMEPGVLFTALE